MAYSAPIDVNLTHDGTIGRKRKVCRIAIIILKFSERDQLPSTHIQFCIQRR